MSKKYWWEEDNKQTTNKSTNQTSSNSSTQAGKKYWWEEESKESSGGLWWDDGTTVQTIGSNVSSRVNTWLNNHNTYISNYQKRNSGRKYDYSDSYVSDSSDWLTTASQQKSNFDAEAESILSYMDQYKDYLDSKWVNNVRKTITEARGTQNQILKNYTADNEWWSSFGSEDMVKQYGSAEEAYKYHQRADGYSKKYASATGDDIQKALDTLGVSEERDWLRLNQGKIFGDTIRGNTDFQNYVDIGSNLSYTDFGTETMHRGKSRRQRSTTSIDKYRAASLALSEHYGNEAPLGIYDKYDEDVAIFRTMEDEEFENLAYCIAYDKQNGTNTAEQYVDFMEEILSSRRGTDIGEKITSIDIPIIEDLAVLGYGAMAGVDSFAFGLEQSLSDKELAYYPSHYANAHIADSLDGFGYYAHSAATNIGNMAPSILVSAVATGLGVPSKVSEGIGSATMGVSAAGNAYKEALSKGYDQESARIYGNLVGASEGTLQYLIGGIGKLGGVSGKISSGTANLAGKVAAIDNSLLRVAAKLGLKGLNLGLNIGSEVIEEELQNYLEPAFRTIILGEEYDAPTMDELIETAIVTALSTGVLEGGDTSKAVNKEIALNQDAVNKYGGSIKELIDEGLASPIDSESYRLATKYQQQVQGTENAPGKSMNGYEIRQLIDANDAQFAVENFDSARTAAENRLKELGQTEDIGKIAEIVAKRVTGQKLTRAEISKLTRSYGSQVAKEIASEYSTDQVNTQENGSMPQATEQAQNGEKVTGGQVIAEAQNAAQTSQVEPMESHAATIQETQMVETQQTTQPANDQQMTGKLADKETLQVSVEGTETEAKAITLEDASKKYGAQAKAMIHTYQTGQDVAKFDQAYKIVYDMGRSGVGISYAMKSDAAGYLTDAQKEFAYEAGKAAADTKARAKDAANKAAANGNTEWKKGGVVRGEGVTIADLRKAVGDVRGKAYKSLSTIAKATGVNIVLFKSQTDADGNFIGEQGVFDPNNPNDIRIDINAGLENISDVGDLEKYVLLRTFSHEFTHFIEKWNPIQYNEFRKVVFDTLTQRGVDVDSLIAATMEAKNLDYEAASREVVAEAMTDILQDANFVQMLAEKHQTIFRKLLEKLKEFAQNIKDYFDTVGVNDAMEANALKEQGKYLDSIVKLWDEIAVQAVENYQQTVATEKVAVSKKETTTTVSETESVSTTEETTTSEHGFTITDNAQYGSLEITFDGKPPVQVRDVLKAAKFRWNGKKGVWYGKADRDTITKELNEAFEAENAPAENPAMQTLRDMGAKPAGENMLDVTDLFFPELKKEDSAPEATNDQQDAYANLESKLQQYTHVDIGGIRYSAKARRNGGYYGNIIRLPAESGVVPVENARDRIYSSYNQGFETREEAIADLVAVARNSKLLDGMPTETTKPKEEVTTNGKESENGTDTPAVHESVRGSEGPARLLEGVEPEAVRGGDQGRKPVQSGSDQGSADAGRDGQTDAAGSVSERSTRDRVGGDLQRLPDSGTGTERPGTGLSGTVQKERNDNDRGRAGRLGGELRVNEEVESKKAEELHEEVQQEIEKKSTVNPKGGNFVIGDSLNLPNGTKARTRANIDAIKLVKQIAAEDRIATPAEQEILSKYVGWGGLADAFGKPFSNHATRKIEYEAVKGLEAEFEELKSVLTEEEYKSARESTKNAHYTSIEVIKAMYDGLKQLGFTGGRMLEPSSGVGNFVGAMPADMSAQVKSWTMVEIDNITGLFAKYLYPNADVRIQGFEETNIPDGYMDVAIGNVPFGNYAITDKHYPKAVTSAIHNYFFAKSLDKVRTGGIVMFITSSYTMNARDSAVRKYIMQRADLLGAIRLPNTAFAGNAGTEVVTDILILKKRAERTEYAGEAFESSDWERVSNTGWDGAYVNEYFIQHPEMVLGTPKLTRGMYSSNELTYDPFTDRGSLGEQIREAMKNIHGKMDYAAQLSPEKENFRQGSAKKKHQKLIVKDGEIHAKDENGNVIKVDVDKDTTARIAGMVAIRDAHVALCDALQQGVIKQEITKLRKELNKAYDSFVEKYGYLNAPKNKKAINTFTDRYAIQSLENYSTEGKKITVTKSDIFSKDTIAANRTASSAENVEEGLTISLNSVGYVDAQMIARLTGQDVESVTRQMIDQRLVFKDKDGNLIPAAQYLSGNVRAKLREMEGLVGIDSDYRNNVESLREVVPPTVQHTDIYVNPGANWVPVSVYENFVGYILNRNNYQSYRTGKKDFSVEYVPETNEYKVSINDAYAKMSAQNTQVWGEGGKAFSTIFENMLNGRRTNVYKDSGDGTRVLDKEKTEAVAEKVEKLNEEFRKWLWEDEARRAEMQELYNETYNALVTPKYSGANLTVNGLNSTYELRAHQKDAVARIINSGGNTLLAHRVGAGKTMEMAAAAMKLKQLGVIKKSMFVVPNNVVAQWGKEFKDYFPAANILVVGDEDMTPAERMTTINRIKNNDYDAVILAATKFEKIQMTAEWRQKFYEEQIESIMFAINAEKESQGGKGFRVKQLEAKRKQLEAKVKKLTDKAKDEDGAMFEDLGVDALFVDEAHNYKNLEYSTRMNNVSGLGKADGSQRAFDLYTKVRYLQQLNGGRGVVFATATPVMNSMTEMYIMQKYLQPDTLKQLGIEHFDSWAKMFGEVVNALEIAPSGSGYRLKQTFSKFKNVKALQQLFRSFTDVLTDIPGLKIPKMKGGKVQIVQCEQGEFQKNYMEELAKRAENVKNVDPKEDNMLKITSDGRKIAYSQRMIDPSLPYEETGKIYMCCDNVYAVYQESNKTKGTQMIFCDMATPKGKASSKADADTNTDEFADVDVESAQLYDDMKSRLVQLGIPAKEIAFIHDAKNDKQKADLSEKMNNGTIRVLIGSTGKMGVGLNAQKKAVAIHHLDAPWRPGDIEQRDGRVFRQKNENDEAYKFVYVTKGSFDSRLWDILERKQNFINQVMNGEDVGNEIEDTGEVTLSAAEVKAVASDNPLIMEQVALEKEISKLQSLQQAHRANISRAEEKIVTDRRNIANLENLISNLQEDMNSRKDTYSSDKVFSIQIGTQTFTDKKDAGAALLAAAQAQAKEGSYTAIGKFAGFTLRVVKTPEGVKGQISGAGNYEFKTYPLNPTYGINHLISIVEGMGENLSAWNKRLDETKSDLETQKQLAAEPFEQAEKLKEKRARYNEVMYILNPPKDEQTIDSDGGDTVQYQRRKRQGKDIRDDIYYPKDSRDAHAFIRSFADQTSGMKGNQTKHVLVSTENHAYFVEATGYLTGNIEAFYQILGNEQMIEKAWREFDNGTDKSGKAISSWRKDYRSEPERSSSNSSGAQRSNTAGENAGMDGQESRNSDTIGSFWNNYGYSSWEELLEAVKDGAMVMDENGNLIVNKQYQQRTRTLSNREVLSLAASELQAQDLTPGERNALDIFEQRLAKLEALQEERAEQGRLYKEQQFGAKVDRSAAEQTLSRMKVLDGQIENAKADVLSIEDKQVLKQLLQKARKVVEKHQWTKDQEALKRYRDRRNNAEAIKKYRTRLTKDVTELTNWVLHPNNKDVVKHIPDVLKNSVIPFLSSIDFTSKKQLRGGVATKADQEFMKRLNGLKAALKPNQSLDGLYGDYSDLPPNFMDRLQKLIDTAQAIVEKKSGEFVVNEMTSDELRELSQVVRTLKTYIQKFNLFHANAMFQHVSDAGDNSIGELAQMGNASDKTGTVSNFVFWQQIRPAYAWERFGEGGKAIYDGLRRGQAKLAFNTKTIQEFAEKAYTEAEVKAWEKEIKSINLGGDIVKMPVSTIMSLYELSKRPQALGHILGGGIRVATFTVKGKKISDAGHTITPGDMHTIIGTLTDRQKEVADKLQKFMQEQGGKWGNYVSVKRFGEELFGEDNYFPINSDGRHLAANADEHPSVASLYALLNMGFTKALTEGANNRVVLYSVFDVFANHMASMAQYNAFALPIVDAIKWFNYQQKSEPDENGKRIVLSSVRDQMDRVYGVPEETRPGSGRQGYAQTFVINIIRAFNGTEAQGTPTDAVGINTLRRYNMAQVAYNLRVAAQQPLAITRAALLVDYGSIIKGMKLTPAAIQKNIQEMQQYSGIAAWKGLGFYDVNISRGLTEIIKHSSTVRDKISNVGMLVAEKADLMTWAGIWSACKEEVIKKQHLTPTSDGFYEAVTQLFEDVIYKTQVVDSVLTKNEYMRSKGFFARATGSFMSEPITTASMLIDAYDKYHMDIQKGMNHQQAWKKNGNKIVRTVYVYGLSAVLLAAVQAVADSFRDDDDEQEWYEKWLEAFGGNLVDELMPLNKLPLLSDFYEVAKELLSIFGVDTYGNAPTSVFMQWYDSLVKGAQILYDKISGEDSKYTWYGGAYKLLQAASGMSGLPMAAATREIVTAWNNIVGAMAPSLKVKTYEPGEKNEIKFAYQDGWLTAEEAIKRLIEQGFVDNEDEAYWIVKEWEAGDGNSRYEAIYDAVLNGGDFEAAMDEMTSHGYKEDDVISQVKSQIGKWYYDSDSKVRITKQQAIDMLTKYTDMDSEEITATVNKWSCKVVTGIAFGDIKDEYIDGNITASRAIEMYVRYGNYTKEEAAAKVSYWDFCKENPKYDYFSESNVNDYLEFAEPANISLEVYAQFVTGTKGLETKYDEWGDVDVSKRDQVLEVIDSLPLTWQQKDALYLAAGYSENKIWDVPW